MGFEKFCPKCGKRTDFLFNKVCKDCFLKENELFSVNEPDFTICKKCKKILFRGSWSFYNEELIAHDVASKIKVHKELLKPKILVELKKTDLLDFVAEITVSGFIKDALLEQKNSFSFEIKDTLCDSCMKLGANYREAIIQLRAENNDEAKAMLEIAKSQLKKEYSKDSLSGLSKLVEIKNGFDLWVGSKKAAAKVSRYLSKLYKTKIIASSKLIGEDENGKRKYRFTFCIKK